MLSFRGSRHGELITITGPNLSGKTTELERLLNSAHGIIWDPDQGESSNIVVAKHPRDDISNPGKIAGYPALETADPDAIAARVTRETEAVVISGINFFEDPKIVDLLHALVISNRKVYVAGHNLDWEGRPFNFMPQIMSISNSFILKDAPCMVQGCRLGATRSQKVGSLGERRCLTHHYFKGRPDVRIDRLGGMELFVGNMYASKTTAWYEKMKELDAKGIRYAVFKWFNDKRFSERGKEYSVFDKGVIGMNNHKASIPAVLVRDMDDMIKYIKCETGIAELDSMNARSPVSHIFIDEGQFIKGIYNGVNDMIYQGYRFYVTGLLRTFKMEPFGEMAELLAIADKISVMYAYCESCGLKATESQRLIVCQGEKFPAPYMDKDIAVGSKETDEKVTEVYEARCIDCMEIPGKPKGHYTFKRYVPISNSDFALRSSHQ
ncbi:MAG: hypothetical protein V1729_05395 [Candidatus Woesearchaeota archaeon]